MKKGMEGKGVCYLSYHIPRFQKGTRRLSQSIIQVILPYS